MQVILFSNVPSRDLGIVVGHNGFGSRVKTHFPRLMVLLSIILSTKDATKKKTRARFSESELGCVHLCFES